MAHADFNEFTALISADLLGRSAALYCLDNYNQSLHLVLLSSNLPWAAIQSSCHVERGPSDCVVYQCLWCDSV
jgi:hypothetical protein